LNKYIIYTDGSCSQNPGAWGYAAIILDGDRNEYNILKGGGKKGTNNIAELTAVLEGLKHLEEGSQVKIYSDSKYVTKAFNAKWINGWVKRDWRRPNGPLKNKELWQELWALVQAREVEFIWVRGHNGHKYNELADQIAGEEAEKYY
jgi:ribonuclease HI